MSFAKEKIYKLCSLTFDDDITIIRLMMQVKSRIVSYSWGLAATYLINIFWKIKT